MKYEVHVSSKDMFGHDVVDMLLHFGNLGAKVKEGTFPRMKFPYSVILELEAEEPPMPSGQTRVFDYKSKEVFANVLLDQIREKEKAVEKAKVKEEKHQAVSNFSTDQEVDEEGDDSGVSLALNPEGKPWTKEQLEDLDWNSFKKVVKTQGISGRDRQRMTRQYLDKVAESQ